MSDLSLQLLLRILLISILISSSQCGIYKMMAEALMSHMMGWDDGGKGITFGLKSKGMTAIIPIPLPIPMFSKGKGGGGQKIKYIPVPVPSGKEDWWR